MKVGPHVMTHSHSNQHHHEREIVPRVGSAQAGGNLKLIQCQLMLLLHARRCQQRNELLSSNRQSPVTNNMARAILLNCPIRHCRVMKEVLNHMKTCRLGGTCTFQHCTTSLRILSHWTNCTIDDCPLCQCVRQRMRRAKEWEATLPRSSRYTLLAAALRSSQAPRPAPLNCHVAEQAQEGQSGVPCLAQDELRPWPRNGDNQVGGGGPHREQSESCDKPCESAAKSIPSMDQVRKAYEQLGIPCDDEALKRLMSTLPSSSSSSHHVQGEVATWRRSRMDTSDGPSGDQGVFDCSSSDSLSPSSPADSDSERVIPPLYQQLPVISSTTNSNRLPFKSSTGSRPK